MTDSKRAHTADVSDLDRLEGLKQTPQEFYHRGIILQQMMDRLFKGTSIAKRGTLCQLKLSVNHRNVSSDVMNSFNYVENFIRFTTEAHIVYLAMKLCGIDNIDAILNGSQPQSSQHTRRQFLLGICRKIVDTVATNP